MTQMGTSEDQSLGCIDSKNGISRRSPIARSTIDPSRTYGLRACRYICASTVDSTIHAAETILACSENTIAIAREKSDMGIAKSPYTRFLWLSEIVVLLVSVTTVRDRMSMSE